MQLTGKLKAVVRAAATSVAAVALLSTSTEAQSVWLEPINSSSVSLEVLLPQFKAYEGVDRSSVSLFMMGRAAASDRAALVIEVPWTQLSYSYFYQGSKYESPSESSIGNIYIGGELRGQSGDYITEVGIRLPSAPEEKYDVQLVGQVSDLDRLTSFGHIDFAAFVAENYYHVSRSGLAARVRAGATFVHYSSGSEGMSDIYIQYGGQIGGKFDKVRFMAGITGLLQVTHAEGSNLGERTIHQFGFIAEYMAGQLRPGVQFRLPLDKDLSDVMNCTIGLNVSYVFGQNR